MKHVTALLVKYIFTAVITGVVFTGTLGADVATSLWVAAVITLALYLLGDMMILPAMGNTTATAADTGVALLLAAIAPLYSAINDVPLTSALLVAVLIGIAEYFFHAWLERSVLPGNPADTGGGPEGMEE